MDGRLLLSKQIILIILVRVNADIFGRLNTAILEYLKDNRDDEKAAIELENFILDSVEKTLLVFGDTAFKRINLPKATSINKSIAELQLVVLSKFFN